MIIYMSEGRTKSAAKRLRKVLRELGVDLYYMECLNLAVRLLGFDNYSHFCRRDADAPLSPLDEQLSDADFAARDEFQMGVLAAAGLGPVARELLERANPTGAWGSKTAEEIVASQEARLD
jgi:hypothetical protein